MDAPVKINQIGNLPVENIIRILSGLDPKSLAQVCKTSKKLARICKDKEIWRKMYLRDISSVKPCLEWNWEKLYGVAMTQRIPLFYLEVNKVEWVILGDKNLTRRAEEILREEHGYTNSDIEDMRMDLGMKFGGNPDIGWIVSSPEDPEEYTTPNDDKIFLYKSDEIPVRDIFNLFPRLKKLKPKTKGSY